MTTPAPAPTGGRFKKWLVRILIALGSAVLVLALLLWAPWKNWGSNAPGDTTTTAVTTTTAATTTLPDLSDEVADLTTRVSALEGIAADHEARLVRLEAAVEKAIALWEELHCGCLADPEIMAQFELLATFAAGTPYEGQMAVIFAGLDECGRIVVTSTSLVTTTTHVPSSPTTTAPTTTTVPPSPTTTVPPASPTVSVNPPYDWKWAGSNDEACFTFTSTPVGVGTVTWSTGAQGLTATVCRGVGYGWQIVATITGPGGQGSDSSTFDVLASPPR